MKKLSFTVVAVAITLGLIGSSSAAVNSVGDPGRSWAQPNDDALGLHVQQFLEIQPGERASFLVPANLPEILTQDPTCSAVSDTKCAGLNLQFSSVIPYCASDSEVDCIVEFGTVNESGKKIAGSFNRYFPTKAQNAFQGFPSGGIPAGATGSLIALPGSPHDGGSLYYSSVVLSGSANTSGEVTNSSLEIRIAPVALEYTSLTHATLDAGYGEILDRNTGVKRWGIQSPGFNGTQSCMSTSASERMCAQRYAFPSDTRFYISIRLTKVPGGWMHGRISSPDIQITKFENFSLLEFEGNPIAVPAVYKANRYSDMPEALKQWYDVEKGGYKPSCNANQVYCAGGRSGPSSNPLNRNVIISPEPWDKHGMDQLKLWLPYVNDKATALPSFWSVRTLSSGEMAGASQCFADSTKITGIVTTNSTQYSAGPPAFDKSEGTLGYQVASPHYGTTGDVFKGSYDLVMRSEVARCVYGFSKAPIQASLSITSADGSPQIATTVMGERNGWLYLSAKNFEFSAPVIKAKLSQEAPAPTASPTPSATATVVAKPKLTITCVKGKLTKKVTAITPKCPTGYKKKG